MEYDEDRVKQGMIPNSNLIPINKLYDVCKGIVKIYASDCLGTGCFIKFVKNDKYMPFLMTNEHVISKEMVESKENIEVLYDNQRKMKKINLNKTQRFIQDYRYLNIDAIIVEILPDEIGEEYFLIPSNDYKNGYNNLIGKDIIVPQFPLGGDLNCSYGKIKEINLYKNEFSHLASTEKGSSGSPIFLRGSSLVIGIHKQTNKKQKENFGNFIQPIINSLKKNVEISEKKYENGIYEGEFKNNVREGNGKFTFIGHSYNNLYEDGEYYIGQFKNNKFNGRGMIFYRDNTLKYVGFFINDIYNGEGKLIIAKGCYYTGQFKNGKRNGKGILYSEDKVIYKGNFVEDKINGFGRYYYENGLSYEGQIKNGMRHGNGKLLDKDNKIIYDGAYLKNKRNGEGILYMDDGSYYIGSFKNNKKNGYGFIYNKDGSLQFQGNFVNDEYDGNVILHNQDGNTIAGEFEKGNINGNYYFNFNNESEYQGKIINNNKVGKMKFSNEFSKLEGEFKSVKDNKEVVNKSFGNDKIKENEAREKDFDGEIYDEDNKKTKVKFYENLKNFDKNEVETNYIFGEGDQARNVKAKFKILENNKAHAIFTDEDGKKLYEGEINILTGYLDGKGKLYYSNGNYYIGEFKKNSRHGQGKLFNEKNEIIYEGTFVNDQFEGNGKLIYESQNYYVGEFKKNKPDGEGKYYEKGNKLIYKGHYVNGKKEGQGFFKLSDESYYIGEFIENTKTGKGKLFNRENILIYDGDFLNDKYEGKGKLFTNGILKYEGCFKEGKYEGEGKLYDLSTNKLIYDGNFLNGEYNGEGKLFSKNGNILFSNFKNGEPDGEGTIFDETSNIIKSGHIKNIDLIKYNFK